VFLGFLIQYRGALDLKVSHFMASTVLPTQTTNTRWQSVLVILGIAACAWIAVYLVYVSSQLDWLTETDTADYWSASENLAAFPNIEMPGYPILIAVARALLPPQLVIPVLQAISLLCYTASVGIMYYVLRAMNSRLAFVGALLFGLYPLVGAVNAVAPRVNSILLIMLTIAIFAYTTRRNALLLVILSLALMLHKSAWIYVVLLILLSVFEGRVRLLSAIAVLVPFGVYWALGTLHHDDVLWLIRRSYDVQFAPRAGLLLFDGIVSSVTDGLRGSLPELIKAGLLLGQLIIAFLLIYLGIWKAYPGLLSLLIPPVLFALTLNQMQILATINYTTFLAVPIVMFLSERTYSWTRRTVIWVIILGLCFISQIGYAAYVVAFVRA
jgi:hypothetical protein